MNQHSPLPFNSQYLFAQIKVAFAGRKLTDNVLNELSAAYEVNCCESVTRLEAELRTTSFINLPDVLLLEVDEQGECFSFIERIKKQAALNGLIIILLAQSHQQEWKTRAQALRVHDFYIFPLTTHTLRERIQFLVKFRIVRPGHKEIIRTEVQPDISYRIPASKRAFDVIVAALALLLLSPLLVMIAIMIVLESRGPIIYRSKRVGTGYRIFNFYKFRSMHVDAEAQLQQLSELNQYAADKSGQSVFTKIANDPRVTKVGSFIRNTSIDELPQLVNILLGDMSFVGNRPLPVYEAEQLTSNEWSKRFLGPAGLTGLWQISKRGKKDMSETERKELDNYYVSKHSFFMDLQIILKTLPALLQKEKV